MQAPLHFSLLPLLLLVLFGCLDDAGNLSVYRELVGFHQPETG